MSCVCVRERIGWGNINEFHCCRGSRNCSWKPNGEADLADMAMRATKVSRGDALTTLETRSAGDEGSKPKGGRKAPPPLPALLLLFGGGGAWMLSIGNSPTRRGGEKEEEEVCLLRQRPRSAHSPFDPSLATIAATFVKCG